MKHHRRTYFLFLPILLLLMSITVATAQPAHLIDLFLKETILLIQVHSPWYFSWWAYIIYFLIGAGLLSGFVKLRLRQLQRKSRELEHLVADRDAIVMEQRNRLKQQSEKLQEMDALKSRFFANISHELRTPLTLVLGLIDKFKKKTDDPDDLADYQIIQRNSNRLLQLINQLLALSNLESGSVALQAARQDIVQFTRRHFAAFSSLGEQKSLSLSFNGVLLTAESEHAAIFVYFDTGKLEKAFTNLFANTFKNTPENGRISVSVAVGSENELTIIKTHTIIQGITHNNPPGTSGT